MFPILFWVFFCQFTEIILRDLSPANPSVKQIDHSFNKLSWNGSSLAGKLYTSFSHLEKPLKTLSFSQICGWGWSSQLS